MHPSTRRFSRGRITGLTLIAVLTLGLGYLHFAVLFTRSLVYSLSALGHPWLLFWLVVRVRRLLSRLCFACGADVGA